MKVVIIDSGICNLGSIRRAMEECGANVIIGEEPSSINGASHLILPGVGAFPDGMHNLQEQGWIEAIHQAVTEKGIPILGICLGMQLLAEKGFEVKKTTGLGLIPGEIRRFVPSSPDMRIPHVGWNGVHQVRNNSLLTGIPDGADFYFVHSYVLQTPQPDCVIARTSYFGEFVAAVNCGNVFGVQFHPEKSGQVGFKLLKNYLNFWKAAG